MADTVAYVRSVEQLLIDVARRPRAARRRSPARLPRRVGRSRRPTIPARSPPSACASPAVGRCTASRSTSIPTWRTSATSCRAASPTRPSPRCAPRGSTSSMQRGRRRGRRPGRRAVGAPSATPSWSAPMSCGATGPTICPRSAGARGPAPWPDPRRPVRASIPTTSPPTATHAIGAADRRSAGRGRRRAAPRPASPQGLAIAERKPEWMRRQGAHGRRATCELKRDHARARPRHRVRGGRLPEHLRVLGRRHRHVHDQRRALHPGLRLLPGRHPPPRAARRRRARTGWPRRSSSMGLSFAVVTAVARDDLADGGAAAFAAHDRGHPRSARPGVAGRGADPRLQGRPRGARRRSSPPAPTC